MARSASQRLSRLTDLQCPLATRTCTSPHPDDTFCIDRGRTIWAEALVDCNCATARMHQQHRYAGSSFDCGCRHVSLLTHDLTDLDMCAKAHASGHAPLSHASGHSCARQLCRRHILTQTRHRAQARSSVVRLNVQSLRSRVESGRPREIVSGSTTC